MLLCAARHLAATRQFSGTLNLIFQPAEENFGGAKAMMDDGLFDRFPCDAIFAIHNMPGRAAGDMAFRTGAAMASADRVTITLRGSAATARCRISRAIRCRPRAASWSRCRRSSHARSTRSRP